VGVEVIVRTPAGRSRSFDVDRHDTVTDLVERVVEQFVAEGALEAGHYRLGLLRGPRVVDLDPGSTLGAEVVRSGAVLHLLVTDPQVDG
jgi:hypothetical protein